MSAAHKAMDKTFYRMMACSLIEAVNKTETSSQTIADVERAAAILEKFWLARQGSVVPRQRRAGQHTPGKKRAHRDASLSITCSGTQAGQTDLSGFPARSRLQA